MAKKKKILLILIFLISGFVIAQYLFSNQFFQGSPKTEERQVDKMNPYEHVEVPRTKIPTNNASALGILRPLLERVWVTKYYGTPAEVFGFHSSSLCSDWPEQERQYSQGGRSDKDTFLWKHKCRPVEVLSIKTGKDLSGVVIVRMLDFGKSEEILQDVFEIIKTNSLGSYRMGQERKNIIKDIVAKELGPRDRYSPINYRNRLRTYSSLEEFHFVKVDDLEDVDPLFMPDQSDWAKKHAFSLQFDAENYRKKGDIIELTLITPSGFFGTGSSFWGWK